MPELHTIRDLDRFREACQKSLASETKKILVCSGTGCLSCGAMDVHDTFTALLKEKGLPFEVEMAKEPHGDVIGVKATGCHGLCELGPVVRIEPEGWMYTRVKPEDCDEIIEKSLLGGEPVTRLAVHQDGKVYEKRNDIPFYQKQTRLVYGGCDAINSTSLRDYIAIGGFTALKKVLSSMSQEDVVEEIDRSNLRGRGGGGFRAGVKWKSVLHQEETPKYVVCNGDEGDPGAFMDQGVMEGIPGRMIEGMIIAGLAVGAEDGYIYVRAEYPTAVRRLGIIIRQAEELGLLGDNILGSGRNFHIHINRGAGAFVCGEGSALTASIEGKRGMPRVKPPRTVEHGLFAKPTVLNNVETYANVPLIIENGADWYLGIGPANSPGTKAFSLTGNIRNTGLIEVPMGITLREVIYDIGGGIRGGKDLKAVQIGGPSGGCLTKEDLDLPLDFDSLKKVGAIIGSGGLVVMDEDSCMVEVARFFMHFTQNESCGKCVPCREGTKRMLEILERITQGEGREEDLAMLEELADTVSSTSLCGLGKTAPNPVKSTLNRFRDEYIAHIRDKRCPAGVCSKLKQFVIQPEKCKGCSRCARQCPVSAIHGDPGHPFAIDQEACIKCSSCKSVCAFDAIGEVF